VCDDTWLSYDVWLTGTGLSDDETATVTVTTAAAYPGVALAYPRGYTTDAATFHEARRFSVHVPPPTSLSVGATSPEVLLQHSVEVRRRGRDDVVRRFTGPLVTLRVTPAARLCR
jgi:hypothetical protein